MKKLCSVLLTLCIIITSLTLVPAVSAVDSAKRSDWASMYGIHLNYDTELTLNHDGTYTLVADLYSSYAVKTENVNFVVSKDGYYTVDRAGRYLVEIWGGDGASANGKGGAGGYVYGVIELNVGDTLYYTLGGGGQTTNTAGVGGGANGGGHYGDKGSTTVGGGGGYSALFLFDTAEFEEKYLDKNNSMTGKISELDRVSKYVMIAGGGGGGGSYASDSEGTADGGAGGYIGSTSGVLGDGYDVAGTFFAGTNGLSTGTSNAYAGRGGTYVPGEVVSTIWGWGKSDSPNDWRGTYNANLVGGAGGSGNYRGGAGGAGFCGGSGGVVSNVVLATNVGGGGGGSSFISNEFTYQLTDEQNELLIGRQNTSVNGEFHLVYLDETDDEYLKNVNIAFARTPYFTVNDVYAVNRVYDETGAYTDIEYTVKTAADPEGKIIYTAVDYPQTNLQALRFDFPAVSLMPEKDGDEGDRLFITVSLSPKTDFAGGNNVPLFVDDVILCTPADTNYEAGSLNLKNDCGYVNVPLNFDVATVNHTPQGVDPEDVVHPITSLYVDKYASVRSDPSADWKYHFIESIGTHVVKDDTGKVITDESVSPDETTRYIVELSVTPKMPTDDVFARIGNVVGQQTFMGVSVITVAGSGMDSLNDNVVVYNKVLNYDEATGRYILSLTVDSDSSGSIADYSKLPQFNDVGFGQGGTSANRQSTLTIPITGKYTITLSGGDGGKGGSSSVIANNGGNGGKGGSITATFYLEAGTPIRFYAGMSAIDATQARGGGSGGEASYVAVLKSVATGEVDYYLMIASGGGGGGGGIILGSGDAGGTPNGISNTYRGSLDSYNGKNGSDSGWTGGSGGAAEKNYVYNGTADERITLIESTTVGASADKNGYGSIECVGLGKGNGSIDELKGYTVEAAISKYFEIEEVTLSVEHGTATDFNYSVTPTKVNGKFEYSKIVADVRLDPVHLDVENNNLDIREDVYKVHYTVDIVLKVRDGFLGGNNVLLLYLNDTGLKTGMKIHQSNLDGGLNDVINLDESRTTDYANVAIPSDVINGITLETLDKIYVVGSSPIIKNTLISSLTGLPDLSVYDWEADYVTVIDPRLETEALTPTETTVYVIRAGVGPRIAEPYASTVDPVESVTVDKNATIFTEAKVNFKLTEISAFVGGVKKTEDVILFLQNGRPSSDYVFELRTEEVEHEHHLPDSITLQIGDRVLEAGVDYEYNRINDREATVTVYKETIDGNLTVIAEICHKSYSVNYIFQLSPGGTSTDSFSHPYHYGELILPERDFAEASKNPPSDYEHYDFVWDWGDGKTVPPEAMPKKNLWASGSYVPKTYNVVINYVYTDGTQAMASKTEQLKYGSTFAFVSPELDGYVADRVSISGTVEGNAEYTVTYKSTAGILSIFYLYAESGEEAARPHVEEIGAGSTYYVNSPIIDGYTADTVRVQGTMTSDGATYYVYYTAKLYNVTFDANGGDCPVTERTLQYGKTYGYNAETHVYDGLPTPVRVGYTFECWTIKGIPVDNDKVVNALADGAVVKAQWKGISFEIRVDYVYADGKPVREPAVQNVEYGKTYFVASPEIRGYTPDVALITGTAVAQNMVYTVTYTANTYTLKINYLFAADNSTAAPSYVASVVHTEKYSVTSPVIGGHACLEAVVEGTVDAADVTVNVYYYSTAPVISVTVNWGSMSFEHTVEEWNPDTHEYTGDRFTPAEENAGRITVTNNAESTVGIRAEFSYSPSNEFEAVNGYFAHTQTSTEKISELDIAPSQTDEVYLRLEGKLSVEARSRKNVTVGVCTVTIRGGQ